MTIYFWKISKEWYWVAAVGYVMNLVTAICSFFLPESPSYLLEKGKIAELAKSMQTIASWNRR